MDTERVEEDIRHRSAWLGAQYFSIRKKKYQKKQRKKSGTQDEAESKYVPTKWLPGFSHFTVAVKLLTVKFDGSDRATVMLWLSCRQNPK